MIQRWLDKIRCDAGIEWLQFETISQGNYEYTTTNDAGYRKW